MLRAIIIEDEDFAVQRLQMLLGELTEKVEVIAVLDGVKQAVKWLSQNKADLIFLDIHLADGNAFKIFEQVEVRTPIIFTTAYHDYALRAFEQFSIDYLLKPVSREKLQNALAKMRDLRSEKNDSENNQGDLKKLMDMLRPPAQKRFMVQVGNKLKVVELSEIAYFTSDAKVTFVTTKADGKRYPIEPSLKQLENTLPQNDFFRINRQYLIHRQSVKELLYLSTSRVKVSLLPPNEEDVVVARERLGQFKKWLVE